MSRITLAICAALAHAATGVNARADILINEVSINPPGKDGNFEYVELLSPTGETTSADGYALVVIVQGLASAPNDEASAYVNCDSPKLLSPQVRSGKPILICPPRGGSEVLPTSELRVPASARQKRQGKRAEN